jgi:hypothetical protein
MRRAVVALTAILVIVFLMQSMTQMVAVEANPYNYISPYIFIESPTIAKSEIYQTTSIPIKVTVFPGPKINLVDIYYILDGGPNIKLSIIRYENSAGYFGRGTLDNLTDGYHTLKAFSHDAQGSLISDYQGKILSDSRTFLVNTTFRYPTLLLSPMNITYYIGEEVLLTYTIDDSKYTVYYELDNSRQTHLTGNTTLSGLSEGQHTIKAGAYNVSTGIYSKQTAYFEMNTTKPAPTSTPTPTPIEVGGNDSSILSTSELIIPVIIVVGICLILGSLLKRRHVVKR